MKYDNTPLTEPLVEEFLDTVKMNIFNRGRSPGDGSKFVKSVRFVAWEALKGTSMMTELEQVFKTFEEQFEQVEKSCLKLFVRLQIEGAPRRSNALQLKRRELTGLRATEISQFNVSEITPRMQVAAQHASDTECVLNTQLGEAYFNSDTYLNSKKELKHRGQRVIDEFNRVGDSTHCPQMRIWDRRTRLNEDCDGMFSHQGDTFYRILRWFAEAQTMCPHSFWFLMSHASASRITINNYEEFACGNLSKNIDKFGVRLVGLGLACLEFETTGESSLPFYFDQSTSGVAFLSIMARNLREMRLANLLGGKRQDAYMEILAWVFSLDAWMGSNLSSWKGVASYRKLLRVLAKLLAKGGIYEGGASVMAYHICGLEPDKMLKLSTSDWSSLEKICDFSSCFLNHPDWKHLFDGVKKDGSPKLAKGITWLGDIYPVAERWCAKVAVPSLGRAITSIKVVGGKLREANAASLAESGDMLSWKLSDGFVVRMLPFKVNKLKRKEIIVRYKGYRAFAWLNPVSIKTKQNVSGNKCHSDDGDVVTEVLKNAASCDSPYPVLTVFDSFGIHGRNVNRFLKNHGTSLVHVMKNNDFDNILERYDIRLPRGSMANVVDRIPKDMQCCFAE